mmetsp:Transcript_7653/g.16016  ORF Transcript_7653/g.16016 Transcript_7653/m.16016 type:complete len:358 (+) Transcript_7653:262-1335(+)
MPSPLLVLLILVEDMRRRGCGRHHRVRPCLVIVLLTAEIQVPVHHNVLLHLQQSHLLGQRGQKNPHQDAAHDHDMLDGQEDQNLARVRPRIERVGCEDDDRRVGQHGKNAEDVEGRVPRLVVGCGRGEGASIEKHQLLLVQETFQDVADERKEGHPRASDNEERRVAVQDEHLIHVLIEIVILLLALTLSTREVRHNCERVREHSRVESAALHVGAVHHEHVRHGQLDEILQRQPHDHEDGELLTKVVHAIVIHALHLHTEQVRVRLEKGNVVQGDVAVHELEDDGLGKEVVSVFAVCAVVLPICQTLRYAREDGVHELHNDGVDKHKGEPTTMLRKDVTEGEEHHNYEDQGDEGDG